MISVILTCFRRFENLAAIMAAWKAEPEVDELILWDNSGSQLIVPDDSAADWHIRSSLNFGARSRYLIAPAAKNEIIMLADDDLMPGPGLVADMLRMHCRDQMTSTGGRIFTGGYYQSRRVDADNITVVYANVDFVLTHACMVYKEHLLGFDCSAISWACDDLYVQGHLRNLQYVVPRTSRYRILPEASDENALCAQPGATEEKERVWREYYGPKEVAVDA